MAAGHQRLDMCTKQGFGHRRAQLPAVDILAGRAGSHRPVLCLPSFTGRPAKPPRPGLSPSITGDVVGPGHRACTRASLAKREAIVTVREFAFGDYLGRSPAARIWETQRRRQVSTVLSGGFARPCQLHKVPTLDISVPSATTSAHRNRAPVIRAAACGRAQINPSGTVPAGTGGRIGAARCSDAGNIPTLDFTAFPEAWSKSTRTAEQGNPQADRRRRHLARPPGTTVRICALGADDPGVSDGRVAAAGRPPHDHAV